MVSAKEGRLALTWSVDGMELRAVQPTAADVLEHAAALAEAYNEPFNRSMMGHAPMTVADVVEHWATVAEDAGARAFLFFCDGVMIGDGDLRNLRGTSGELALMIGPRGSQGRGLGTRFSMMLNALAFRELGLEHLYVSIIPANTASLRIFERFGYVKDDTPEGRSYADEPEDIILSTTRAAFEATHAATLDRVRIVRI